MKLGCRFGLHDWLPWSDSEEVCREKKVVEKRDKDYHYTAPGVSYNHDKDHSTTTITYVIRRMIQTRRCKYCNLEQKLTRFDDADLEVNTECIPDKAVKR